MSKDEYPGIFSWQIEATVFIDRFHCHATKKIN